MFLVFVKLMRVQMYTEFWTCEMYCSWKGKNTG